MASEYILGLPLELEDDVVSVGNPTDAKVREAFRLADLNDDMGLSRDEFAAVLQLLDPKCWTDEQVDELFQAADADHNDILDVDELLNWVLSAEREDILHIESESDADASSSSSDHSCIRDESDDEMVSGSHLAATWSPASRRRPSKGGSESCPASAFRRSSRDKDSPPAGKRQSGSTRLSAGRNSGRKGASPSASPRQPRQNGSVSMQLGARQNGSVSMQPGASPGVTSCVSMRAGSGHLERKLRRSLKLEEPPTTLQEIFELFTMSDGRIGGHLMLVDLANFFAEAKKDGLGPRLAQQVPQRGVPSGIEPEDVSVLEFAHLYALLLENPGATADDAVQVINAVKDDCRSIDVSRRGDRRHKIEEMGLAPDANIGYGTFCRLMELISATMQIDTAHILSTLAWVRTSRFEMTEAMASEIMERVFLKAARSGGKILDQPISENDFVRVCHSMHIIDNKEKTGISHGKIALLFGDINKKMPRLRHDREARRYTDRGSIAKKPRKRKHSHKNIVGRTQLSILFEELLRRIPSSRKTYRSPFGLVLTWLEIAGQEGGRSRLR